jgi:hypothetical protein
MFPDRFTFVPNAHRGDEYREELRPVHKVLAAVLSVAIAVTMGFAVAMPFALLHIR